eukprot:3965299-Heterocapsa_arctica.AAC.1
MRVPDAQTGVAVLNFLAASRASGVLRMALRTAAEKCGSASDAESSVGREVAWALAQGRNAEAVVLGGALTPRSGALGRCPLVIVPCGPCPIGVVGVAAELNHGESSHVAGLLLYVVIEHPLLESLACGGGPSLREGMFQVLDALGLFNELLVSLQQLFLQYQGGRWESSLAEKWSCNCLLSCCDSGEVELKFLFGRESRLQ